MNLNEPALNIENLPSFGVEIIAFDYSRITARTIEILNELVMTKHVVLIRNIKSSPEQFGDLVMKLGRSRVFTMKHWQPSPTHPLAKAEYLVDNVMCVSGAKYEDGESAGVFGHHSELDWHGNRSSQEYSEPVVINYAASGTKGSVTSICNCAQAYSDLAEELKNKLREMTALMGFKANSYTVEPVFKDKPTVIEKPFVIDLPLNAGPSLYFHFHQIMGIKELNEADFNQLMEELKVHVLQEKYIYSHHWQDGDILLHNQLSTIHKRHNCNTDQRVLLRSVYTPNLDNMN